jgi:thiol-disulfide isomerase/thioredoxin
MKRTAFEILSFVLILGLASACSGKKKEANASASTSQPGEMANTTAMAQTTPTSAPSKPDITFEAVDTKGVSHSSSEWIGKEPTVVNLWGTWCPPCRREIPDLVKLYAEYHPKGVQILGVAMNDTPDRVEKFAPSNNMNWVMLMGTLDIARQFQTSSVPLTVFYDKSGKEVARLSGAQTYDSFKDAFEKIVSN